MPTEPFDAVVLTGGRGTRLGGVEKAQVVVAGRTLLDRARAAVSAARTTVVLGAEVSGGPVAAVAAALPRLGCDVVVLLACDMPLVTDRTVLRLLDALCPPAGPAVAPPDAVLLTDRTGRRQYLAGAYRTAALRAAVLDLGDPAGRSMRRLVEGLRVREVAEHAEEAMDCDTWSDVDRAVRLLEGR